MIEEKDIDSWVFCKICEDLGKFNLGFTSEGLLVGICIKCKLVVHLVQLPLKK